MSNLILTITGLSFAFVSYLIAGVLRDSLKKSQLIRPIAITICSITIAYNLVQARDYTYIVAAFAGFFLHTCVSTYVRKPKVEKAEPKKKDRKVVNINP